MHYSDDEDEEPTVVPEEHEKTESETSAYLSTQHTWRSKTVSTAHSLFPPLSWPSSADLIRDSDVYPLEKSSQKRGSGDSLDSSALDQQLGPAQTIQILPSLSGDSTICESSRTELDSSQGLGKYKCNQVCGPKCICTSQQAISAYEASLTASSSQVPAFISPEFDIANIATFLELPISKNVLNKLCFGETLVISCDKESHEEGEQPLAAPIHPPVVDLQYTDEIGGMCISIEQSNQNIVTYCTSQFSFQNCGATSSILSVIDRQFTLVEEKRTERLHKPDDNKEEKTLHVFREKSNRYTAFRSSTTPVGTKKHRGDINLKVEGNLLLDGAGFVLMRYLILKKFQGDLEVWSMHINGEICRCVYSVGKSKLLMINNRPYETIRIVKFLIRTNRKTDVSKTYFLPSGHLVRHRWMGCPYFIHINPITRVPPCNYFISLEKTWENDIQLFSKYLDFKQENQSQIRSYLSDNGEVKCMIKDYLLCLLQSKPRYVLDFTIDYFQNLLCEE